MERTTTITLLITLLLLSNQYALADKELYKDTLRDATRGYNAFKASPVTSDQNSFDEGFVKTNLISFKYEDNSTSCTVGNEVIPDAVCSSFNLEQICAIESSAHWLYTSVDYQEQMSSYASFTLGVEVEGVFFDYGGAQFTKSVTYDHFEEFYAEGGFAVLQSSGFCKVIDAEFYISPKTVDITQPVIDMAFALPTKYNSTTAQKFFDFYDKLGTHLPTSASFGARFHEYAYFYRTSYDYMQEDNYDSTTGISCDAHISCVELSGSGVVNNQEEIDLALEFRNYSATYSNMWVGCAVMPENYEWEECTVDTPELIYMDDAMPIQDLVLMFYPELLDAMRASVEALPDYCEYIGASYCLPPVDGVWSEEFVQNEPGSQIIKPVVGEVEEDNWLCVLTHVSNTFDGGCQVVQDNREVGDVNYYWYLDSLNTAGNCKARCSSQISWYVDTTLARTHSVSVPGDANPTKNTNKTEVLADETETSFCYLHTIQNQNWCGDWCKLYPPGDGENEWVLELLMTNSQTSGPSSYEHVCSATCVDIKTPEAFLPVPLEMDSNNVVASATLSILDESVTLTKVDETICVLDYVLFAHSGGCALTQEPLSGLEGVWWVFSMVGPAGSEDCPSFPMCSATCYSI